ncbi:hypothetical protein GH714_044091 [Hevea brasiliensis]|uniref:Lysozyme n=1 Tax=Hevea brasiliensis TaxID=3981 RepID=A0A6A6K205_HEVBR|nr:hypothetical protein GH714_044091 [Hevea brasiliensis]
MTARKRVIKNIDPGTGGAPYTAGYGHTGPDVKPGMNVTQAMADKWFDQDVAKFENGVSNALTVETTQNQFDAMVSLAYNIGLGNFTKSTLLRKHNAKCWQCAAAQFGVWRNAGGKMMTGLIRRRAAERELYMS